MISPLIAGTILQQRYRVGRAVGHGGMGAIYEARDERLDARVALKQILHNSATARKGFEREAQVLANLQHHSLPKVSDLFVEDDAAFLVMDFIDGPDIAELIENQGALPIEKVLSYADALLDVLNYLHTRQPPIFHRDIKPQNIKVDSASRLVLLDFGIAKGFVGSNAGDIDVRSVPAYTRPYAPIEQILGTSTTAQSDLFSLGATLYHMLTGQLPVSAGQRHDEIDRGQPDPLIDAARLNTQISSGLSSIITHLLALRAQDRPSSAELVRSQLKALDAASHRGRDAATTAPRDQSSSVPSTSHQHPRQPLASGQLPSQRRATRDVRTGQGTSLQKRIHSRIKHILDRYPGAWMVWCDPRDEWRPLLERVAEDGRLGTFHLIKAEHSIVGELGGLLLRQEVQQALDARKSFVLWVPVARHQLGWMWAHALLAEEIYTSSLREQLLGWGWQPQTTHMSAQDMIVLARQGLQQDPAMWGGGSLQPDIPLLLEILASGATPGVDERYLLDMTTQLVGLPPYDEANPERWRIRGLASLLVTQAHQNVPRLIGEDNSLLVPASSRTAAIDLLFRWVDSMRLSRGLADLIVEADKIAAIDTLLSDAQLKDETFLSRAAERVLFITTCERLSRKTGRDLLQSLVALSQQLREHKNSFWGNLPVHSTTVQTGLTIPWRELERLSHAAQSLLDTVPSQRWSTPDDAIAWYCTRGWRLDTVGDAFVQSLSQATPELVALITPLRDAYRARWEQTLLEWFDVWTRAGCPLPSLPTAGAWVRQQLGQSGATAIMMIDALRYDIGALLVEEINKKEGSDRALMTSARAPLPSITALGMGLALPLDEQATQAVLRDGRWHLIERSSQRDLSIAEQRRAWLRDEGFVSTDGIIAIDDLLQGHLPKPAAQRKVIVITDDLIDKLGHDDELETLGTSAALQRYRHAVTQLRDAGWRRILVVTDHGYIHWLGTDEKRLPLPLPNPSYRSRRVLAYPAETRIATPHLTTPDGAWHILPARGASCWNAYGRLGYFHGGASLQEWIIPCLRIEWPAEAQPVSVRIRPINRILSAKPRIALDVEQTGLSKDETLPRQIEVIVRRADTNSIIFRSSTIDIIPGKVPEPVSLLPLQNVAVARDTRVNILVRDPLTEEVIVVAESVMGIDLDDW